MTLPAPFLAQMERELSPDEYGAFLGSFNKQPIRGLRLNKLKYKASCKDGKTVYSPSMFFETYLKGLFPKEANLQPVPWCREGYSFYGDARPSKWLWYHTGLYYLQEPSAMCPVEVLSPKPGETVLDLCAAPGGKTVQMAGHMLGDGLLVSNDKSPSRCRGLIKNIELAGITNAVVLSEEPRKLALHFPGFFDKILVDAPCSGEGMFRRDRQMTAAYSSNKPEKCARVQKELLHFATVMLKPGGKIVYSTCTFNQTENEGNIADLLDRKSEMELEEIRHESIGVDKGLSLNGFPHDLSRTGRIWPHKANGEGHFIALLSKKETAPLPRPHQDIITLRGNAPPPEFSDFSERFMVQKKHDALQGTYVLLGENLYLQRHHVKLDGLRVARSGFHLGVLKKGRFVPSQALAMAFTGEDFLYKADLPQDEASRYLKGESIPAGILRKAKKCALPSSPSAAAMGQYENQNAAIALSQHIITDTEKPWLHIGCSGLPLGFAKLVDGRLKNCLPVNWVVK